MPKIPLISPTTALCACFILAACTPAQPPSTPPAATSAANALPPAATAAEAPAATPAEAPVAAPPATVAAASEPAASTAPPAVPDLVDSPGDARLDPAAGLIKAGQHLKARLDLTKVLPDIDRSGTLDAKMAAHALLGRACSSLADAKCAAEQYGIARAAWKDPAAAVKELDLAGGDDKAKLARQQRALNAAGEALFFAAEEKRHAAEKEKFPAYTGKGDKASVLKHVNTKVASWVKARRALLQESDKEYSNIANLQPAPPPRWVVASAASVGMMWGRFVAEFRAAPVPHEWLGAGVLPGTTIPREDIRAEFYAALDEASAPERAVARSAFKTCQDLSQKLGIKDERSKICDDWLAKNPAPTAAP